MHHYVCWNFATNQVTSDKHYYDDVSIPPTNQDLIGQGFLTVRLYQKKDNVLSELLVGSHHILIKKHLTT